MADPTAGEVRIGCNPSVAAGFASAVVDRLSRRYPRMAFHLVTGETETLYRRLNERDVDFLIAILRAPIDNEQLELETLYEDPLIVATGVQKSVGTAAKDCAFRTRKIKPRGVGSTKATHTSLFNQAFRANGLQCPRATVVAVQPEVRIASLLTTGRFLSVLPASVLKFFSRRAEIKILPVELSVAGLPNGIADVGKSHARPRLAKIHPGRARGWEIVCDGLETARIVAKLTLASAARCRAALPPRRPNSSSRYPRATVSDRPPG